MKNLESLYLKDAQSWRDWLRQNHDKVPGIWLIYFKKHTGQPRVQYDEAVEEALCFGWIDSIVKRIDEDTYMQKFTPRKPLSKWSPTNKKRVEKLIKSGKMKAPGITAVNIAKEKGKWDDSVASQIQFKLSSVFIDLLKTNRLAFENYDRLTPLQKKQYANWVMSAKKPETRLKRFTEMIRLLEKNEKPGMK
jgi:uncharacterized protein YdeI (YjbR/CyaY-like superfamily)